ncbi:tetratricopeptide repeat protein [Streptomyces sp. cmx-4-9]|uniref:tetratricopeptide repeat protein n=1 Tax=Streptomyces sp. cmx-4-9 TaxID=2790941 RepID=UPI0039806C9F
MSVDVRITGAGYAEVAGRPVVAGVGEELQDAVLDYLHRQVLSGGAPVLATVWDERIAHVVRIQVLEDGSSRLTAHPEPLPGAVPAAGAEPAAGFEPAAARTPGPEAPAPPPPAPVPARDPLPVAAPAPEPAPEPAPRPAPQAVPAPPPPATPVPPPSPVPVTGAPAGTDRAADDLVAGPGARIQEALRAGRIEWAATLAQQSVNAAAESLGWESPEVLQLRELNAYVAFVAGDNRRAFHSSLEIARIRSGRNDPQAVQSVLNAAAAWLKVTDPAEGIRLGHELIALWSAQPLADAAQLESARARMRRLEARAAAG